MSAVCRSILSSHRMLFPKERLSFNLSLYLVANRPSFQDENQFFFKIREAVKGGVSCVQLRDHKSAFATTLKTALYLKNMLQEMGVPLFVNTLHLTEVARAVNADGVYLEEKRSPFDTRALLGQEVIIGIPVKTMDEVLAAEQINAVDYLSVKVSPSKRTCPKNDALWGMDGLRNVRKASSHRIVAIGGLNLESAESVYRELRSDDGIAMAGGLLGEEDPRVTAQKVQAMRLSIPPLVPSLNT